MGKPIVSLFDQHGNAASYRRVSARIGEFRDAFSVDAGYRIESEIVDALSLQPGIMALYQEAIRASKPPKDMGLSAPNGPVAMVCVHRLYDKDGRIVMDARASKVITEHKDLETLETASLQRLMARVGFGGDVFDEDENGDYQAQGLSVTEPATRPEKAPVSETKAPAKDEAGGADTPTGDTIPTALRRQLEGLRKKHGVEGEMPTTVDEAKRELKELTSGRGRKTTSAQ